MEMKTLRIAIGLIALLPGCRPPLQWEFSARTIIKDDPFTGEAPAANYPDTSADDG
jgi:hypothetical protein